MHMHIYIYMYTYIQLLYDKQTKSIIIVSYY